MMGPEPGLESGFFGRLNLDILRRAQFFEKVEAFME